MKPWQKALLNAAARGDTNSFNKLIAQFETEYKPNGDTLNYTHEKSGDSVLHAIFRGKRSAAVKQDMLNTLLNIHDSKLFQHLDL